MKGKKFDAEKPRWDLMPLKVLEEVVDVLTMGAKKYSDGNWMRVPDGRRRYFAACLRHLTSWQAGEKTDKESGKSHLAHAVCCLIFLLWYDLKKNN